MYFKISKQKKSIVTGEGLVPKSTNETQKTNANQE